MPNTTPITIIGNMGSDPELRFTPSGLAVVNFSVAVTPRTFNRDTNEWVDGDPAWYRCTAWREMAENIAESLTKGDHVIVSGDLVMRAYETRDGDSRVSVEIAVDEVGHTLRFGTTKFARGRANQQNNGRKQRATSSR